VPLYILYSAVIYFKAPPKLYFIKILTAYPNEINTYRYSVAQK